MGADSGGSAWGPALPWMRTEVWRRLSRRTVQGQVGLPEAPRGPCLVLLVERGPLDTERPAGAEGGLGSVFTPRSYDCIHCAEEDGHPVGYPPPGTCSQAGCPWGKGQGWGGRAVKKRIPGHLPCLFMVVPGVRRWWKWRVTALEVVTWGWGTEGYSGEWHDGSGRWTEAQGGVGKWINGECGHVRPGVGEG